MPATLAGALDQRCFAATMMALERLPTFKCKAMLVRDTGLPLRFLSRRDYHFCPTDPLPFIPNSIVELVILHFDKLLGGHEEEEEEFDEATPVDDSSAAKNSAGRLSRGAMVGRTSARRATPQRPAPRPPQVLPKAVSPLARRPATLGRNSPPPSGKSETVREL